MEKEGTRSQSSALGKCLATANFPSQVTQDVVKRLHNSWESFKQRGHGFPRFKKYGRYQSFLFPQFKQSPIRGNQIKLPMMGLVNSMGKV